MTRAVKMARYVIFEHSRTSRTLTFQVTRNLSTPICLFARTSTPLTCNSNSLIDLGETCRFASAPPNSGFFSFRSRASFRNVAFFDLVLMPACDTDVDTARSVAESRFLSTRLSRLLRFALPALTTVVPSRPAKRRNMTDEPKDKSRAAADETPVEPEQLKSKDGCEHAPTFLILHVCIQ